jgi:predicted tellurium resistance membrane protein TerC
MVMSLDNVLAIAAAAHGDASLIVLGLLISIPLVVGGATLITGLLTRFPILVWAGAALLGWVAGELIATEPALHVAMETIGTMSGLDQFLIARLFEAAGAVLVCTVAYVIQRSSENSANA